MKTFESEKTIEEIEGTRNSLDEYDREVYDFKLFKECQDRLDNLHRDMQSVGECSISDFGEAIADGKALDVEYKVLEKAYDKLHDRLYPIMKETYKGYKSHCEFCRIPYSHYEEFEEADEEDLFASILGM